MADISNIIYSKYIQATRALNKHAIKVSNNLGSGIKSKERMRKFNLMSAWLDLLGTYINRPRHSKGASVPSVFLTDFTFEAYNSLQLACDIEDSIGGHTWIFAQFSEFAPNYNVYQEFYAAVLDQKQNGDWAEGVTVHKNDTLKSVEFRFPKNSNYNGGSFTLYGENNVKISYGNSNNPFEGGQDPVLTTIAYDNISKAQFLEKLDLIAIELGIVYDLSEDLSLTISEIDN
tara:strand:- start:92 stop:784 length:693 start_codon:yes stop_codon:yes gene_type:complete